MSTLPAIASPVDAAPTLPLTYKGERVLTTARAAEEFGVDEKRLQDNYLGNVDRFEAGKHFHKVDGAALRAIKDRPDFVGSVGKNARSLILWTERGVARHAKILNTDVAWEIFETLEDTYFRVRATTPTKVVAASPRETRLWLKQSIELGALRGLEGAQLAIYASRITAAATGFTALSDAGAATTLAPTNDALIVPKVIGDRLGISAKRVNVLLGGGGYQESFREADGALKWRPTEKGRAAGGRMMDVDRGNGTGAAQQLKWPFSIIETVRDLMEAKA